MAANVAVAQDPAGNLKPAKDKSTERIDGIVALIMAIGRAMLVQGSAPATALEGGQQHGALSFRRRYYPHSTGPACDAPASSCL
jgi:hypothetical protein